MCKVSADRSLLIYIHIFILNYVKQSCLTILLSNINWMTCCNNQFYKMLHKSVCILVCDDCETVQINIFIVFFLTSWHSGLFKVKDIIFIINIWYNTIFGRGCASFLSCWWWNVWEKKTNQVWTSKHKCRLHVHVCKIDSVHESHYVMQ